MTLDDLTVKFQHLNRQELLADWRWLIGSKRLPILLAASGDAFLQDQNNGAIFVLDVAAGEMMQIASDPSEFQELLTDHDFVTDYFAVEMISDLRSHSQSLAPGQIFTFKKPPVLGGEYVLENIEATDIEVHFSLTGQIHEQARSLPEGTPIQSVVVK